MVPPPHDVESNLVSNEILDFVVLMWYLYRRDLSLKSPQRERAILFSLCCGLGKKEDNLQTKRCPNKKA